jgi:undecaprenyl-diphosphatase
MNLGQALSLGLIQGVAEFLPISSSGHLVMGQHFFGWQEPNLLFNVWLHLATLLAVVIYFWSDIVALKCRDVGAIVLGSVPAILVGLFFSSVIEAWFGSIIVVGLALIITGVFNLVTNRRWRKSKDAQQPQTDVSLKQAVVIGLFQSLAITPGISRSGSTLFAGAMQGLEKSQAFKFSFLLSVPAILGAVVLQLTKVGLVGLSAIFSPAYLLAGLGAFVSGILSLSLLKMLIKKTNLFWFGWYCLAVGAVVAFI